MIKRKNNFKDTVSLVILILGILLIFGGSTWGSIQLWLMEWDHAISRSEKFHIWFHLWFSPGISVILGLLIVIYFRIKGFK